jgi:flagellar basal body-associated protein FliL
MENSEDNNKMNFDVVGKMFTADQQKDIPNSKGEEFKSLPQLSGCVQIPCDFTVSVSDFIKDLKEEAETPKSKKKRCDIICFISAALFILLAAVYVPLFYGRFFKPSYKPIEVSVQPTLSRNNGCNCCRCMTSLPEIKLDVDFSSLKGDSAYYDVLEVKVLPDGASTFSYHKFDKLIILLAIILTVGVCTVLVFIVLYKRKCIAADHECEKLELENQNKLVNKYVEARLAEQQLNIKYNEEQLSLARQWELYKMDMHQKEHDNWWKHVATLNEAKKIVLLAMVEAEKEVRKAEVEIRKGEKNKKEGK